MVKTFRRKPHADARTSPPSASEVISLDLIDIEKQVRTQFDPNKDAELDASVKAQGIILPVVVLAKANGRYRLIAGERRVRSARRNGLIVILALVKHDLAEWEIRRIQVAENVDRDGITAHDEARSVSEDVATYGFAQAMVIWNRSEGWISKRAAVARYAAPVQRLLEDRVLGDLEVAHSLNQLHALDEQEFMRMDRRLRAGLPLSREEARGKVQQVKEWTAEQRQRDERRRMLSRHAGEGHGHGGLGALRQTPSAAETGVALRGDSAATHLPSARNVDATSALTAIPSTAAVGRSNPRSQDHAPAGISSEQAIVLEQMVALFQHGVSAHGLMEDIQVELAGLGADMHQTEWAMWSLFQTVALPLLAALGEARAQRYLQRTIGELRVAKPQAIWNRLHPALEVDASDDWTAARAPVTPMPEGWQF